MSNDNSTNNSPENQPTDVTALVMSQSGWYMSEQAKATLEAQLPAGSVLTIISSTAGVVDRWIVSYTYDDTGFQKGANKWSCMITQANPEPGFKAAVFTLNTIAEDIRHNIEERNNVNAMHRRMGWDVKDVPIPTYTITVTLPTPPEPPSGVGGGGGPDASPNSDTDVIDKPNFPRPVKPATPPMGRPVPPSHWQKAATEERRSPTPKPLPAAFTKALDKASVENARVVAQNEILRARDVPTRHFKTLKDYVANKVRADMDLDEYSNLVNGFLDDVLGKPSHLFSPHKWTDYIRGCIANRCKDADIKNPTNIDQIRDDVLETAHADGKMGDETYILDLTKEEIRAFNELREEQSKMGTTKMFDKVDEGKVKPLPTTAPAKPEPRWSENAKELGLFFVSFKNLCAAHGLKEETEQDAFRIRVQEAEHIKDTPFLSRVALLKKAKLVLDAEHPIREGEAATAWGRIDDEVEKFWVDIASEADHFKIAPSVLRTKVFVTLSHLYHVTDFAELDPALSRETVQGAIVADWHKTTPEKPAESNSASKTSQEAPATLPATTPVTPVTPASAPVASAESAIVETPVEQPKAPPTLTLVEKSEEKPVRQPGELVGIAATITTLTGIPVGKLRLAMDRPYPDAAYKEIKLDGGRKGTDINQAFVRDRFDLVFGPHGLGWKFEAHSIIGGMKIEQLELDGQQKYQATYLAHVFKYRVIMPDGSMEWMELSPMSDCGSNRKESYAWRAAFTALLKQTLRSFGGFNHLKTKAA